MAERTNPADAGLLRLPGDVGVDVQKPTLVNAEGTPIRPYERKAGNWINAYLEYVKESESPDAYHMWAALSALSASVRRNVWLDQNLYTLFANIYVALVGPPGRTAKSTALYLSRQILSQVPYVRMGPDSCTREQLIKAMEDSKFNNQCAMTIYSTEFSSLIGPSGILMIQFLLDIYDCNYTDPKKGWQYQTKGKGENKLVNPFLSGMFCTTPSYLAESIPDNIIGHGFTSRMIFVFEELERLINPRPKPMDMELASALVSDLRHISHLSGEFKWANQDTMDCYDEFYKDLYHAVPEDHRLEGYHWRKKIHVLKVAMLLSLAEDDSLIIARRDIESAVQILHSLEKKMARVFQSVGKYEYATDAERVGNFIHNKRRVTEGELYTRFYHIGGEALGQILSLLIRMRTIRLEGSDTYVSAGDTPW